jgi:hypothetical protein
MICRVASRVVGFPLMSTPQISGYKGQRNVLFEKTGFGKKTFKNQDLYEGSHFVLTFVLMPLMMLVLMAGFWRRGKRSGFGKHFYSHGDIYEGQFLNDLENGKGKFLSSMGVLYRGEFENGLMHGSGILKEEDGSVYEGEFQQGEKHGVGLMIYSDGSRYHGEWREGKAFGFGRSQSIVLNQRMSLCVFVVRYNGDVLVAL